jgi:seryl-tRNA synthetase
VLDPRLFRDADAFAATRDLLARRGAHPERELLLDRLRELAERRRGAITAAEKVMAELNSASAEVGRLKKQGGDTLGVQARARELSARAGELDAESRAIESEFQAALLEVPNVPARDVVAGDAGANQVVRSSGTPLPTEWRRPHWEVAADLGLLDFERSVKLTGSGFPLYTGMGARLERALINYLLDLQAREHGYTEVSPPFLVNRAALTGTGQLPRFEDDLYRTSDDLFLIPTAEVPVTNLHRDEILEAASLPRRYVSYTPCWRREAGAAGADTRGILRVHQFDKVEIVWFSLPEEADRAHEALTAHAETALQRLGLAYRVLKLAAGDMGFANHRTYDLEAWAPGVGKWLEVSSCSTYSDYQARRMNIRFRRARGGKPEFVNTLNGSALGLARVLVAIIETYQQRDGSLLVPEVLVPLAGAERIGPGGA